MDADPGQLTPRTQGTVEPASSHPQRALVPDFPDFTLSARGTALLIVDLQYLDAHPEYGVGAAFREKGLFHLVAPYFDRLSATVIPNICQLLYVSRRHRLEVVFSVIEALTRDGRDVSNQHRRVRLFAPRGSREAQVLDEIKPVDDEIILPKTASGVFNATMIDQILRNMGIDTLIMTGVTTDGCVGTAVRDGADRGYRVILVEDACASYSVEEHRAAVGALENNYAWVRTTQDVVSWIERDARLAR
jgi:nicotinamidase-related amidase